MDPTKATQLRLLVLEAVEAIEQAHAIVATLDSNDQALLTASLDEISLAMHTKLLLPLYLTYPSLEEEGQVRQGGECERDLDPSHRREQLVADRQSHGRPPVLAVRACFARTGPTGFARNYITISRPPLPRNRPGPCIKSRQRSAQHTPAFSGVSVTGQGGYLRCES